MESWRERVFSTGDRVSGIALPGHISPFRLAASRRHRNLGAMPSPPHPAVFLSYAREDANAARRIAEALRSQGVEVWFDQNELRGGDAWDQKIRRQIPECSLFLPIIS